LLAPLLREGFAAQSGDVDLLIRTGGVGQSSDAIWDELKRERGTHAASGPKLGEPVALDEIDAAPSLLPVLAGTPSAALPGLTLVHSNSTPKKKAEVIWPTRSVIGEQMKLFG
jgi:hypothetical protein